jgi:type II secretory pathway predicted ATPase ExeA
MRFEVAAMFEAFYGFSNTPFSRTIPTVSLYKGNDSDELIERLKYTANKQLFAVVIGDSGVGKTTTLRRFVDEVDESMHIPLYISESRLTPRMFYHNLLEQLGFEPRYQIIEAKRQLHKEVEILKAVAGLSIVAIIDEAHLLGKEMLEEIRFLLNFKMDSESPLALILSGQSELWDKLKRQSYAAIRQRIDIQCVVGRLDRAGTSEYIAAQLSYAGSDRDIFTEAAIDEIYRFSGGIPRLVNRACSDALLFGAQNRKTLIDDRMVKIVVEQELISGSS